MLSALIYPPFLFVQLTFQAKALQVRCGSFRLPSSQTTAFCMEYRLVARSLAIRFVRELLIEAITCNHRPTMDDAVSAIAFSNVAGLAVNKSLDSFLVTAARNLHEQKSL